MKNFTMTIATVLFLGVACLSFSGLRAALTCPSSSSASLDRLGGIDVAGDDFEYLIYAGWLTKSAPFIGVVSTDSVRTAGVTDVTYTPAYFFPDRCRGAIPINVEGTKVPEIVHILTTNVRFGPGMDVSARETVNIQ